MAHNSSSCTLSLHWYTIYYSFYTQLCVNNIEVTVNTCTCTACAHNNNNSKDQSGGIYNSYSTVTREL